MMERQASGRERADHECPGECPQLVRVPEPGNGRPAGEQMPTARQRGHGRYFSLELPAGLDGRRRRIRRGGFPIRKAAEKALARLRMPADPEALMTTAEWLDRWLAESTSPRPSTIRG